ncbi:DUF1398 family protein [Herpetosiphon gulosus]|uniref:DUF1398 domain-containing protein n=1 Tax=Herpetosiphon gulosus TaxID=1973496 RepID=A0ABP9WVI0_9CHLR
MATFDQTLLQACAESTLNGTLPFPEVIQRLSPSVEQYHVDLIRLEMTYYGHQGQSFVYRLSLNELPAIANQLDLVAFQTALKASQRGEISYPTFLQQSMAAGVSSYFVFLSGRLAIYVGRNGAYSVEPFPAQP